MSTLTNNKLSFNSSVFFQTLYYKVFNFKNKFINILNND